MAWLCFSHAAHAASLPARQVGMWQSTTFATLSDGSQLNGGQPVVTVTCVDELTDQKFFTFKGSSCAGLVIGGAGTTYTIDSECRQHGKAVSVHTTLVYVDVNTVELIGAVKSADGIVHLNAEEKFQGPCLPGMVPGDEGDIEGGSFVRTDNINDFGNQ